MPQSFTLNVLVHEVHFAAVCRHEWAGASFRTQVEISIFVVLKVDSLCYLVVWMKQFHLCFFKKKKKGVTLVSVLKAKNSCSMMQAKGACFGSDAGFASVPVIGILEGILLRVSTTGWALQGILVLIEVQLVSLHIPRAHLGLE